MFGSWQVTVPYLYQYTPFHLNIPSPPMLSLRSSSRLCSPKQLGRVVQVSVLNVPAGLRLSGPQPRHFSTTPTTRLRDFFPEKETAYIRKTPPSWPHHGWTEQEMLSVVPEHREPKTVGDWLAWKLVRIARYVEPTPSVMSTCLTRHQMGYRHCYGHQARATV